MYVHERKYVCMNAHALPFYISAYPFCCRDTCRRSAQPIDPFSGPPKTGFLQLPKNHKTHCNQWKSLFSLPLPARAQGPGDSKSFTARHGFKCERQYKHHAPLTRFMAVLETGLGRTPLSSSVCDGRTPLNGSNTGSAIRHRISTVYS